MKTCVTQAVLRNAVHCGCGNPATEGPHLTVAAVIDQNDQDVRRIFQAKVRRDF